MTRIVSGQGEPSQHRGQRDRRPTIPDLARAAGLSVATVNRVLSGAPGVRAQNRDRVQAAAAQIGFYAAPAIRSRNDAARPRLRAGFLLLQAHRPFYRAMAEALHNAALRQDAEIAIRIRHVEDLTPQNAVAGLRALAQESEAVGLVSAVHPMLTQAILDIQGAGIPVMALVSQQPGAARTHFFGLDSWKVGRMAGWAIAGLSRRPGPVGLILGHHRFRNQDMNEAGLRSYLREHAPDFALVEPRTTFESAAAAADLTEALLRGHPDLAGLYVAGGGMAGVLEALAARAPGGGPVAVGHEVMDSTRAALMDGRLAMVFSHPLDQLAAACLAAMQEAVLARRPAEARATILPFGIHTRESL